MALCKVLTQYLAQSNCLIILCCDDEEEGEEGKPVEEKEEQGKVEGGPPQCLLSKYQS